MTAVAHADDTTFDQEVLESKVPAPGVAGRYGVRGIPTIALFRDGEPVAVTVGAKPRRAIEDDLGLVRQDPK